MIILHRVDSNIMNKLEEKYLQGYFSITSIEFAHFLLDMFPTIDDNVLLAGFLALQATIQGDTHLDIHSIESQIAGEEGLEGFVFPERELWIQSLQQSEVICSPGEQGILILEDQRYLYVHKYWFYENSIAAWVSERVRSHNHVSRVLIDDLASSDNEEQNKAIELSLSSPFSIISGGPGTGKTYTVFKIILAHIRKALSEGHNSRVALCAPTGKAAARLIEAISSNLDQAVLQEDEQALFPAQAQTIHSLLGVNRNGSFKHHKGHKLAYDLIVVDEASMIDVGLMYRLTQAISLHTNVLLLGDKDQLSSVEAGSVFGDLCIGLSEGADEHPLRNHGTLLQKSYRFKEDSDIKHISDLIIQEDHVGLKSFFELKKDTFLEWGGDVNVSWLFKEHVRPHYLEYVQEKDLAEAFRIFSSQKILSPIRKSQFGVDWLNGYFEQRIKSELNIPASQTWYPGRPILITANDPSLKLANGDTGICYFEGKKPVIYFTSFDGEYFSVDAERIDNYELAYVSTVHKSQGSEYEKVLLLLPDQENRILSKQLLYTAVTRARKSILIVGTGDILLKSLKNKVVRYTGLSRKL